jgi:hypothetical protein
MHQSSIYIVGYVHTTEHGYNVIGYDVTNPATPILLPSPWPKAGASSLLKDANYEDKNDAVASARKAVECFTEWGWAAVYVGDLVRYFSTVWSGGVLCSRL